MEGSNRFKRLLNGAGDVDNDTINLIGGGEKIYKGHGFTFL